MIRKVFFTGATMICLALLNSPASAQTVPNRSESGAGLPVQADVGENLLEMTDAEKREYRGLLKEASTMMGRVGIANIALLHDITGEAADNIKKALIIARKLEDQTPKFDAVLIKLGKLKYHLASGETYNYWLPMGNDAFLIDGLDADYLLSRQQKPGVDDARMVKTKVTLDVKQVRDSLEEAATAMNTKDYGDAQVALLQAAQSTFIDETVDDPTLESAHDNLLLAQKLAKGKDYDGVGLALSHTSDGLKAYQATLEAGKFAQVEKLQAEISALRADIAKHDPSVAAVIEARISAWIHDVESLML